MSRDGRTCRRTSSSTRCRRADDRGMRLMFWTYMLVIAGGLVVAFLVGLTHN
jgi:hypothetical protein